MYFVFIIKTYSNKFYGQVASFYARMLDHDYTSKPVFNKNFFEDWRKEMTSEERKIIKDLTKCNFKEMHAYFVKVHTFLSN